MDPKIQLEKRKSRILHIPSDKRPDFVLPNKIYESWVEASLPEKRFKKLCTSVSKLYVAA